MKVLTLDNLLIKEAKGKSSKVENIVEDKKIEVEENKIDKIKKEKFVVYDPQKNEIKIPKITKYFEGVKKKVYQLKEYSSSEYKRFVFVVDKSKMVL